MQQDSYPNAAGFTAGIETSQEAAEKIKGKANDNCTVVLKHLSIAGTNGATLDELFTKGIIPNIIKNNLSARLGQLCARGDAVRSNSKRRTGQGMAQSIYYVAQYAHNPAQKKQKESSQAEATKEKLMASWQKLRKECLIKNDMLLNAAMYDFEAHLQGYIQ